MKILIVEDNTVLRGQLMRSLREQSYVVDEASDGESGLYKAKNWPYDLVIMDVMMPKMNGMEVLASLRRESDVPVLLLTARDRLSDRVEGLDLGADDYLTKPFDMSELFARIRSIIRRSKRQASPVIEIGEVVIDTNSGKILKGGEEVTLTGMEYAITLTLALEKGKIVSAQGLLDAVLDENDDGLSNSLNVHLHHIRRKLGKEFIKTIRGRGYVIE